MKKQEMREFLEGKGIAVGKTEGDDFSAIFHVSDQDRAKITENQKAWEEETGLFIQAADSFGMSVVIMENPE